MELYPYFVITLETFKNLLYVLETLTTPHNWGNKVSSVMDVDIEEI